MRNFLQSEVLAAEAKFEALQTQSGASLLFSIGTDDAMYLTREAPGTKSGWTRSDISSAQIAQDFAANSGARCATFGTAQCPHGTTAMIHLAMVATTGPDDHLYLSLNNPDADTSWQDQPTWTAYPFDAVDHPIPHLKIVNVFLSEATDKEFIVVDVLRDPADTQDLLYRYYIDTAKPGGRAWQPGDLAMDLSATGYTSALGRKVGQQVDGLYTSGQVSGRPQLSYQPLYNPYGGASKPSRFTLPSGLVPDCIAVSRNADNTSDLYLTAGQSLYCLPAKNADGSAGQADNSVAVKLSTNAMFAGVRSLYAAPTTGKGVIVWGLNASDQVFYTTCESGNPVAGPWSVPLPIVTGAEQVSPYLDRAMDANTFFCHTGTNKLTKVVKSPATGLWTLLDITLDPPETNTPARDVMTYTTRVRVTDEDGQPVPGIELGVLASNSTALHINYLHYSAGPVTPVLVTTDDDGSVTIMETVGTLAGSQITVTAGTSKVVINPMDKAFSKAAALTTPDSLSRAEITSPDGSTQPLVATGTSGTDLQTVATANQSLGNAYGTQTTPTSVAVPGRPGVAPGSRRETAHPTRGKDRRPGGKGHGPGGKGKGPGGTSGGLLDVNIGDLLRAVGNAIVDETLDEIQVLEDAASATWQLIVRIAGQTFQAVLDSVESIAESAYHLLSMIVDDIKKVLAYLEFLFEWRDITRTKEVLTTMTKVYLTYAVGQLPTVRAQLDQCFYDAEADLAAWAGRPPSWAGVSTSTGAQVTASTPDQSAPASMLSYHYQNNSDNTTNSGPDPSGTTPDPGDLLATILSEEGDTLYRAVEQLIDLGGRVASTPLPDILTELVAIFGETVLDSCRKLLDAAFDVIDTVADLLLSMLDTPLHIPVVSDVLNFFGVPDFSILDLVCWVGAIPATLLYKLAKGSAPFPDNQETAALIAAPDYPSLLALFGVAPPQLSAAEQDTATAKAIPGLDPAAYVGGHLVSAASSFIGGPLSSAEAWRDPGSKLGTWSGVVAIIGGAGQGVAGYVVNQIVPVQPIKDPRWVATSDLIMITRMSVKLAGALMPRLSTQPFPPNVTYPLGPLQAKDWRGLTAYFDLATALAALAPTIYHFIELAELPDSDDKLLAETDEFSTIASIVGRIGYTVAVTTQDPVTKGDAAFLNLMSQVLSGTMQLTEGIVVLTLD